MVVLDDIDRLSTTEIRDVFKLVRLTASFPNIIYIVAFDRERVEEALAEQGVPGRAYLEKIIQVAVDLPVISFQVLNSQIFSALDGALSGIENPGRFDEQDWPDVFMEIIRPLIRNMRDVRRYAAAIHGTVKGLEGQIALADVLALEAVRVFLPDVFKLLHSALSPLTNIKVDDRSESAKMKLEIEALITAAGPQKEVVHAIIERLFPAALRHIGNVHYGFESKMEWLRERRVGHEDILRLYLERVAGEGLKAFSDAEQAWGRMANKEALDQYLRSLDPARLQDVVASLENFQDQYAPEHVVPGTTVLLNLLPDLPPRKREFYGLNARSVVSRVTYRLLRSLNDADAVEAAVYEIIPQLTTLSSKMELIKQIGHREHIGHQLVSEAAATRFEKAWRDEVISAPLQALVQELALRWVFLFAKQVAGQSDPPLIIDKSPELTLALLREAKSETLTQQMGSRAVKRSPRLDWDSLIEIYGGEATLRERIDAVRANDAIDSDGVLALADKYLGGWCPNRYDE